jgi:hypothetical protein
MRLESIEIKLFRNFTEEQPADVEDLFTAKRRRQKLICRLHLSQFSGA